MSQSATHRRFLQYVTDNQSAETKAAIAQGYFQAIKRELERTSSFRRGLRFLVIFLSFLVIAFVSEGLLQRYHGRRILAREHWEAS